MAGWHDRQVTTGRDVRIEMPDGSTLTAFAVGVDGATGALLLEDPEGDAWDILVGEVSHVRLVSDEEAADATTESGTAAAAQAAPDNGGVTK